MAATSSSRKRWLTVALLLVGLGFAGLSLRVPVESWLASRRICEQLRTGTDQRQLFYFSDPGREPLLQQLAPGRYRLTLASDCYSAQCSFEVLDLPADSVWTKSYGETQYRGQTLVLFVRGGNIAGFSAPAALDPRRIVVSLQRDGRPFWDGTPGQDCPKQGFCIDAPPLE